jgi:hypothetical protein
MTARCGPSASQYDEAAHDDRRPGFLGRQRTPIVLAGVGLALGLLAFWLYPRPGELPNPSYDTVTVTSKFPVGIIDYSVDQVTSATADVTITVQLSKLAGTPTSPPSGTVSVALPNEIPFRACPNFNCAVAARKKGNNLFQTLTFAARPGATANATFSLSASGFGESSNGLTASAALPQVSYECPSFYSTCPSPTLETQYQLGSASSYDWSSLPTQRVSDATVVWNEQVTGGEAAGRVAVGINHGNQAWNDDKTFIAGAFIGLAGGALLSALQELLRQKDQPGAGSQR